MNKTKAERRKMQTIQFEGEKKTKQLSKKKAKKLFFLNT